MSSGTGSGNGSLASMVGRRWTVVHKVTVDDLVTHWREEYPDVEMVDVLATSKLKLWMSHACMDLLGGLSVGQEYVIRHSDIAIVGSTVWVSVLCVRWGGFKTTDWEMTACDDFGPIASGSVTMRQTTKRAMERRIEAKRAALAAGRLPPVLPTVGELPGWFVR